MRNEWESDVTWEDECMIFPLLAKPNKVPRSQLSLGVGMETMIMGSVPAIHASLSNWTSTISISISWWWWWIIEHKTQFLWGYFQRRWSSEIGGLNGDGRRRGRIYEAWGLGNWRLACVKFVYSEDVKLSVKSKKVRQPSLIGPFLVIGWIRRRPNWVKPLKKKYKRIIEGDDCLWAEFVVGRARFGTTMVPKSWPLKL